MEQSSSIYLYKARSDMVPHQVERTVQRVYNFLITKRNVPLQTLGFRSKLRTRILPINHGRHSARYSQRNRLHRRTVDVHKRRNIVPQSTARVIETLKKNCLIFNEKKCEYEKTELDFSATILHNRDESGREERLGRHILERAQIRLAIETMRTRPRDD